MKPPVGKRKHADSGEKRKLASDRTAPEVRVSGHGGSRAGDKSASRRAKLQAWRKERSRRMHVHGKTQAESQKSGAGTVQNVLKIDPDKQPRLFARFGSGVCMSTEQLD